MIQKKQLIKDLKKDDSVNDIFVVKFKKQIEAYKNGYRFELRLGDSSKEINYKYWGATEEAKVRLLHDMIKPNDVVLVSGKVNEWNKALEISANIDDTLKVLGKEEYDAKTFVRSTTKQIETMYNEILQYVDSITNKELKKLLEHFFKDKEFAERFKESPAAMYIHHGWIGGLLEHTLNVTKICDDVLKIHNSLDHDLLLSGAMLHDIGKLDEFKVTTSIRMTNQGVLKGHVTIGVELLTRAMDKLGTPMELRDKIIHMLITHMGDYGSSKLPSTPEAMALYLADTLDNRLAQMTDVIQNSQKESDFVYHKDFGNVFLK